MGAWFLAGAALLFGLDILSVDRLIIVTLVGFLVTAALTLPSNPSRRLRIGVGIAAALGLFAYAILIVEQIRSILG